MELRAGLPPQAKTNQTADLSAYILLAYVMVGVSAVAYFLLQMHGGGTLAAAVAQASISLVYGVTALIVVFGVVAVGLALREKR